jgi:hypothetical protein
MDNIIKYDVRKYVEEVIKKEFSSKNNEEKFLSDNRKRNDGSACRICDSLRRDQFAGNSYGNGDGLLMVPFGIVY